MKGGRGQSSGGRHVAKCTLAKEDKRSDVVAPLDVVRDVVHHRVSPIPRGQCLPGQVDSRAEDLGNVAASLDHHRRRLVCLSPIASRDPMFPSQAVPGDDVLSSPRTEDGQKMLQHVSTSNQVGVSLRRVTQSGLRCTEV